MTHDELRSLVEIKKDDLLNLCSDIIRIPSVNPPGDTDEMVQFRCDYLKSHNIESVSYTHLYACARSEGRMFSRWMLLSTMRMVAVSSSICRTMQGMAESPANSLPCLRRCPAMIS